MRIRFLLWIGLLGAVSTTHGQGDAPQPQIRVTGRATVSAQPEQASVDVGVVTEAREAKEAARLNAGKVDDVLNTVRSALGSGTKLETLSYSINPVYGAPEPRKDPAVMGYSVTNIVRVNELSLDKVGTVIDLATSRGANSVSNVRFSLKDEAAAKARALREAATDAKAKAEALADALGLQILGVLLVSEGEPDIVRPMPLHRGEMAMAQAAPPTPIEAGAIEVHASVTLSVSIKP